LSIYEHILLIILAICLYHWQTFTIIPARSRHSHPFSSFPPLLVIPAKAGTQGRCCRIARLCPGSAGMTVLNAIVLATGPPPGR
jgi:hypothetical protein